MDPTDRFLMSVACSSSLIHGIWWPATPDPRSSGEVRRRRRRSDLPSGEPLRAAVSDGDPTVQIGSHRGQVPVNRDEDIATLQLYMSWTFPSCVSSPTLLPRPPRFQHTPSDGFGDISHIRRRNEAYKNALERGR
jgi:hypothetical protein